MNNVNNMQLVSQGESSDGTITQAQLCQAQQTRQASSKAPVCTGSRYILSSGVQSVIKGNTRN
jgi:hypothetical protein